MRHLQGKALAPCCRQIFILTNAKFHRTQEKVPSMQCCTHICVRVKPNTILYPRCKFNTYLNVEELNTCDTMMQLIKKEKKEVPSHANVKCVLHARILEHFSTIENGGENVF